ncbi:hypothetical protein HDZ31DRAFT_67661 [Schizophyllum fasciatum]
MSDDSVQLLRDNTGLLEPEAEWFSSRLAELTQHILANKALLAPIRRLPTEILSEIFLLAVPDDWFTVPSGAMTLPYASVCHAWRIVSLTTPQLWAAIVVRSSVEWNGSGEMHGIPQRVQVKHLSHVIDAYLTRSAGAPLTIVFEAGNQGALEYAPCWSRLVQESARWESADVSCPLAFFSQPMIPPSFARLQSLNLVVTHAPTVSHDFDATTYFSTAPIRKLSIQGERALPCDAKEWPTAWQPSYLQIWDIPVNQVGHILEAFAPCVQQLSVLRDPWDTDSPHPDTEVELPLLHTLDVIRGATPAFYVNPPNLKEVILYESCSSAPHADIPALEALLARNPSVRLTSLTLNALPVSGHRALELLETLPALEYLCLGARDTDSDEPPSTDVVGPHMLLSLTRSRSRSQSLALLPRLEHLEVITRHGLYSSLYRSRLEMPIILMLCSRLQPIAQEERDLQTLLAFECDIEGVTLARARGLMDPPEP